jgi:hypothetical protein
MEKALPSVATRAQTANPSFTQNWLHLDFTFRPGSLPRRLSSALSRPPISLLGREEESSGRDMAAGYCYDDFFF